jgi:hypothetical protein
MTANNAMDTFAASRKCKPAAAAGVICALRLQLRRQSTRQVLKGRERDRHLEEVQKPLGMGAVGEVEVDALVDLLDAAAMIVCIVLQNDLL